MAQFCRINPDTGLFIEDCILEAIPMLEDGGLDPAYVAELVPPGLYWPRRNFETNTWEEGGIPPDPVPPELSEIDKLKIRQDVTEGAILFLMDMGGMA